MLTLSCSQRSHVLASSEGMAAGSKMGRTGGAALSQAHMRSCSQRRPLSIIAVADAGREQGPPSQLQPGIGDLPALQSSHQQGCPAGTRRDVQRQSGLIIWAVMGTAAWNLLQREMCMHFLDVHAEAGMLAALLSCANLVLMAAVPSKLPSVTLCRAYCAKWRISYQCGIVFDVHLCVKSHSIQFQSTKA